MLDLLKVVTDLLRHRADLSDDLSDSLVDTALEVHGVGTCGDVLQPDTDDALGKDRAVVVPSPASSLVFEATSLTS